MLANNLADSSTSSYQPRDVAVDLLCRLITVIPTEGLEEVGKIFPLLTAQSRAVQRAAYTILHRYVPSTQEQVSFDVALSKSTVRLPHELISLLVEAPSSESIALSYGDDRVWADVRSYLLSWQVVFDHFVNTVRHCYPYCHPSDGMTPLTQNSLLRWKSTT